MAKLWRAVILSAVTSCGDSPFGQTGHNPSCGEGLLFFHPAQAEWLGMDRRTSNELLVGRKMKLAADQYTRSSLHGWTAQNQTSGISWCSATPSVVKIVNDSAVALVPGAATLYAYDGQRGDSLTVHVVSTGYALTLLGTDVTGAGLNDSGDVVVGTSTSSALIRNGLPTDLGNCAPRSINDRRQVACSSRSGAEPKAYIWDAGNITPVSVGGITVTLSSINDSGDVAGYTSANSGTAFIIHGSDTLLIKNDTLRHAKVSTVHRLNNRRELISNISNSFQEPVPGVVSSKGVSSLCCRHSIGSSISDSGVAVGSLHLTTGKNLPAFWSVPNATGTGFGPGYTAVINPIEGGASGINNKGEAVGAAYGAGFLWRPLRSITLSNLLLTPDWIITASFTINERAQILAQATNTKTGTTGMVLLTPTQLP